MNKHLLELQHIDVFYEQGWLVLNDLLSPTQIKQYRKALESHPTRSMRNIWQQIPEFKTLSLRMAFARLGMQLTKLKTVRFGCDHLFRSLDDLKAFFHGESILKNLISINHIECALLLNLSSTVEPPTVEQVPAIIEEVTPASDEATPATQPTATDPKERIPATIPVFGGSGVFLKHTTPLNLDIEQAEGPFLLIVYCSPQARYLHNKADPFTHDVKKEHFAFGDVLSNQHHPLLHF